MCHTVQFSTKINAQVAHKMPDLGYPLSTANVDAVLQGETAIAAGVISETFLFDA